MSVIGSAWVQVRGLTDRLDNDIKRSISDTMKNVGRDIGNQMAKDISDGLKGVDTSGIVSQMDDIGGELAKKVEREFRDTIDVDAFEVAPDMDNSALRKVRQQLENLKDDYEEIEATVVPDLNMLASRWVSSRLAFLSRTRFVRFVTTLDARAFATVLAALSGARLIGERLSSLWDRFRNIDKMILGISQWAVLLSYASGWITMFVGDVLSLIVSIGRIIGAVMPLPGILAGLTIGIASTVAVMKDFNEVLPEVGEAFSQIRQDMSSNFWGTAEAPIRRLTEVLIPALRTGLIQTSSALGVWFTNISDSFRKHLVDEIPAMFTNMNRSILISAGYTEQYAKIIEILGRNGSEYLPRLATWFGNISTRFSNFLQRAEASGELKRWADQGIENLGYLGSAIWGLGRIFYEIGVIAEEAGGSTLKSFSGALNSVADVIGREPFRSQMVQVFRSANDMIREISDRSGPAVARFFNSFADVVSHAFDIMGRVVGDLVRMLAEALSMPTIQQGFLNMLRGLGDGLVALGGYLPNISRGFGALMEIIGAMGRDFLPTLGRAFEVVATVLVALSPYIIGLVDGLSSIMSVALAISPSITALGIVLLALSFKFTAVRTAMTKMATYTTTASTMFRNMGTAMSTAMFQARLDTQLSGTAMRTFSTTTAGVSAAVGVAMTGLVNKVKAVGTAIKGAFLSNPIGIVLMAAVTAITHFTQKSAEAKARVDELAATLDQQTGAYTRLTRESIAATAAEEGHLDMARRAGIDIKTYVDALMGNESAIQSVNAALDEYVANNQRTLPNGITEPTTEATVIMNELRGAIDGTNGELGEAVSKHRDLAYIMEDTEDASQGLGDAQNDLGTDVDYTNALLSTQVGHLRDIINLQAEASGETLDHRDNVRRLEESYDSATKTVEEYVNEHGANANALDISTEAGRRNEAALDDIARRTWDLVDSTDDYGEKVAIVQQSRDRYIELAQQLGLTKSEAEALADEVGLIPGDVNIDVEMMDTHARHVLNGLLFDVNKSTGIVTLDGNPIPVDATLGEVLGDVNEATGMVTINGNEVPANTSLYEFLLAASGEHVDISMEALIKNRGVVSEFAETIPELDVPMDVNPSRARTRYEDFRQTIPELDVPMGVDPTNARTGLSGFQDTARNTTATTNLDARSGMATGVMNLFLRLVRGSKPVFALDANRSKADRVRNDVTKAVNNSTPKIQIGGNPSQGNQALRGLRNSVSNSTSRMNIGARDTQGRNTLSSLVNAVSRRTARISIGARNNTRGTVNGIISSISNRVATITVRARQILGFADGGIMPSVRAFASGGIEDHRAQITRSGGPIRIWSEPETGGEAYIPLSVSKRLRSTKILEQVAKMFGYALIPSIKAFNNGGFHGRPVTTRGITNSATIGTRRNEVVLAPESVDAVVEGMIKGLWPAARATSLIEDWETMGSTRMRMRGRRI